MRLAPFLALAALAGPVAAQAPPCDGTYEFFSGKSTVQPTADNGLPNAGQAARAYNNREGIAGQLIRKPQSEGLQQVEVSQCGRQFVLTKGAEKMVFLQSIMDETLYVAQDIGTSKAELTVRVVDHKVMVGKLAGESHGFAFDYPVAMEPRDISMPDMEGCEDDDPPSDQRQDTENRQQVDPGLRSEVIDVVADEIGLSRDDTSRYLSAVRSVAQTRSDTDGPTVIQPGEPGCPKEFAGIRTCRAYPPKYTRIAEVNMLLDDKGRLLPVKTTASGRVRVDEPTDTDYCAMERSLPTAERLVRVRYFSLEQDGLNNVQVNLVDAKTHKAERSYLAERRTDVAVDEGKSPQQQRTDATSEAFDGIGNPVKGRH